MRTSRSRILAGTPSDQVPEILATGRARHELLFVSMSAAEPTGRDAEYLEWHTYDHRPEQYRLPELHAAVRLMATPELVAARPHVDGPYGDVRHVMLYLMDGPGAIDAFNTLGMSLAEAGRMPLSLPSVERTAIRREGAESSERVKVGADVLPWWPADAAFLLLEDGESSVDDLMEVPGVAGAWWGATDESVVLAPLITGPPVPRRGRRQFTWLFLDQDPVSVARRLRPTLAHRWNNGVSPLLATPFWSIHRREDWMRHATDAGPA